MNLPKLETIKVLRKKLEITQARLAKISGISQSMINKIENKTKTPSYHTAIKIFDALEVLSAKKSKNMIKAKTIATKIIISLNPNESLNDAIIKMGNFYDQLPVIEDGKSVGSITSKQIIQYLTKQDFRKLIIGEIMDNSFPVVSENEDIKNIQKLLEIYPAALISEKGNISGIITQSDIIRNMI